ncbi:ABC transporter substrate-binding protein [Tessaracoccus sp. SD287]|uniref:ABC transporter substrate-binding protein n=1 Tax=Tessaracoccus sp. SD287 TaxID=2782008 RepID=UPI001A9716A9|nr:ABC transporter substrate-binding protein [Tessaracoccus sp. SD287]MBO1030797.1 ABC transporter substrate-binding protein [Tessaracoccus sp. SD287]
MINRRKVLGAAGAGAAAMALGGLAGCGSDSGQEGSGTIQFWSNHPGTSKEVEQKIIDAWNAANPDTPANLVDGGANYEELGQKFNAALAGGDLPDVIVASDVTWFNFALNEATTPLDDLWSSNSIDAGTYVDTLREDYAFEGKHYGMPYARSTTLMYFNSEVLEKAGFDPAAGPKTWAEFAEMAPKLKTAMGGKPALIVPDGTNYLDWYFQGMIWTFGGAYSEEWEPTFTKAESIEAGKFLQEQFNLGHIGITKDASNTFGIGDAAGLLQSTGVLGGLTKSAKFKFVTTYLPGPAPGAATGGAGLAIPNGISDERKTNAVKFIDFMTNVENTITFTQATGYMPVRKEAVNDPAEKAFLEKNPNAMTAIKQLNENTAPQDFARVLVPGGGNRIGAGLDRITIGKEDVTKVFGELAEETTKVYERDIKPLL